MPFTKEAAHTNQTITVITKKRRGINSPVKTSRHTIENHQPNILASGNRFVRQELKIFGDR